MTVPIMVSKGRLCISAPNGKLLSVSVNLHFQAKWAWGDKQVRVNVVDVDLGIQSLQLLLHPWCLHSHREPVRWPLTLGLWPVFIIEHIGGGRVCKKPSVITPAISLGKCLHHPIGLLCLSSLRKLHRNWVLAGQSLGQGTCTPPHKQKNLY